MIRAPGLGQGLASCKCLTNTGALVATGAPRQLQGSVTKLCCPDRPPHTHGLPCLWHSGPCAALAAPPQSYPPPRRPHPCPSIPLQFLKAFWNSALGNSRPSAMGFPPSLPLLRTFPSCPRKPSPPLHLPAGLPVASAFASMAWGVGTTGCEPVLRLFLVISRPFLPHPQHTHSKGL